MKSWESFWNQFDFSLFSFELEQKKNKEVVVEWNWFFIKDFIQIGNIYYHLRNPSCNAHFWVAFIIPASKACNTCKCFCICRACKWACMQEWQKLRRNEQCWCITQMVISDGNTIVISKTRNLTKKNGKNDTAKSFEFIIHQRWTSSIFLCDLWAAHHKEKKSSNTFSTKIILENQTWKSNKNISWVLDDVSSLNQPHAQAIM